MFYDKGGFQLVSCIVVADDLTGANATGVLLRKQGYSTDTILNIVDGDINSLTDCECVTFTTNSRGVDAKTAYNRVFNITKMFEGSNPAFLNKRIDSTLRGNLGAETDAMLDAMGESYTAIVVPCAPASGRVTIGGYMTVNGVVLHKTEAALDPKTPIRDPRVQKLFEQQTKYPIASIYIKDLDKGVDWLANEVQLLVHESNWIIMMKNFWLAQQVYNVYVKTKLLIRRYSQIISLRFLCLPHFPKTGMKQFIHH